MKKSHRWAILAIVVSFGYLISLAVAFVGSVVSVVLVFVDAAWRQVFIDYGLTALFGLAAVVTLANLVAMRRRL